MRDSRNNRLMHIRGLMEQVKDPDFSVSEKVVIIMESTPMFIAVLFTIAKTWSNLNVYQHMNG